MLDVDQGMEALLPYWLRHYTGLGVQPDRIFIMVHHNAERYPEQDTMLQTIVELLKSQGIKHRSGGACLLLTWIPKAEDFVDGCIQNPLLMNCPCSVWTGMFDSAEHFQRKLELFNELTDGNMEDWILEANTGQWVGAGNTEPIVLADIYSFGNICVELPWILINQTNVCAPHR